MPRANQTFRHLRTSALAVPLLLALGGCVAAPLIEAAASSPGSSGVANMIQQVMPHVPGTATPPCSAGIVATNNGCGESADRAATTQAATDTAATDARAPACGQNNPGTSGADCGQGSTSSLLQSLAGSMQKLVPGSLPSH